MNFSTKDFLDSDDMIVACCCCCCCCLCWTIQKHDALQTENSRRERERVVTRYVDGRLCDVRRKKGHGETYGRFCVALYALILVNEFGPEFKIKL